MATGITALALGSKVKAATAAGKTTRIGCGSGHQKLHHGLGHTAQEVAISGFGQQLGQG